MAMQFYQAQRAQAPDLAGATAQQATLDQQARNAAQLRAQSNLSGLASLAMAGKEMGLLGSAATATAPATGLHAMLAGIPGGGWTVLGALALGNYLLSRD